MYFFGQKTLERQHTEASKAQPEQRVPHAASMDTPLNGTLTEDAIPLDSVVYQPIYRKVQLRYWDRDKKTNEGMIKVDGSPPPCTKYDQNRIVRHATENWLCQLDVKGKDGETVSLLDHLKYKLQDHELQKNRLPAGVLSGAAALRTGLRPVLPDNEESGSKGPGLAPLALSLHQIASLVGVKPDGLYPVMDRLSHTLCNTNETCRCLFCFIERPDPGIVVKMLGGTPQGESNA